LLRLLKLTHLEANQLYEKLTDFEVRLDQLSYQVCVIKSNELKAASHFRKLDDEVKTLKTARDEIKDDISTLQRAKHEILEYLDEELERLKNVPVSLHLAFNCLE
jgi:predicted  nucleic acid-binding Zn-ribbon protein